MLDVFLTFDVEIWCNGWQNLDAEFPGCFKRYVYGTTSSGNFGLPYALTILADHGLRGVFFVEPLFSARFGSAPLAEIVGLIRDQRQEVQLHLHTEWVDEATSALLPGPRRKRQFLRDFSPEEQIALIGLGKQLLSDAGTEGILGFRAGNFGMDAHTFGAVAANDIAIDSSYNVSVPDSARSLPDVRTDVFERHGVLEYPMTVFVPGGGRLRHVAITACSFREMEGLLWQALATGRKCFTILSHNFELLNRGLTQPDRVVVRRYRQLCSFLDKNRDSFRVRGFAGERIQPATRQPAPLSSPLWKTAHRTVVQAYRRRFE